MKLKSSLLFVKLGAVAIVFLIVVSCSPSLNLKPTPTPAIGGDGIPATSGCEGVNGELEMQVLVGPAEAVGLEPFAVGGIPFSIVSDGETNIVQGGGAITYQETLGADWGTFAVSLDIEAVVDGECGGDKGSEELNITIEVNGEQMVEVRAEGFQGDYPWEGTHELNLSFPLEDGAMAKGEGWAFVLHLNE